MRIHNIILYTNDKERADYFFKKYDPLISDAKSKHYLVNLEGNKETNCGIVDKRAQFRCFPELRYRLSSFQYPLSDIIVVIDSICISSDVEGKQYREIILEYPDVKFVLWCENEKEKNKANKFLFFINNKVKSICNKGNDSTQKDCIVFIENLYDGNDFKKKLDNLAIELNKEEKISDEIKLYLKELWKESNTKKIEEFILNVYVALLKFHAKETVCFDFLCFPREGSNNAIIDLICGYDNLFDYSNIRYACKQWQYAKLNVRRRNLRAQQECRRIHLAVCVEEERGQNRFNSYSLYTNGFRVLPITSASELRFLHDSTLTPDLIVRDYDLQFSDPPESFSSKDPELASLRPIDAIRGFSGGNIVKNSPFWKKYWTKNTSIIFVSKGNPGLVEIKSPSIIKEPYYKNNEVLILPGLVKPINGIHKPFDCITIIQNCYKKTYKTKRQVINTERMNHNHGVPLDIYEDVQAILERSRDYYNHEKYIHSAVLANEAMELMNGFHQSLMLKAYHLFAISENAISMNIIGVNEKELKEDTYIRIRKISNDISWLLKERKDSGGKEQSKNVLNQIFSDCRNFCYDKEHFLSEDVFISAMAHLNDGFSMTKFIFSFIEKGKRPLKFISKRIKAII